jgi:predicted phage-related endonuclease
MSEGSTALRKALNANLERRHFIGGSDARIIMGSDEAALLRLWREKRGEVEPEDLSGNLIVQLGVVTEPLKRHWFERNTGQGLTGSIPSAPVSVYWLRFVLAFVSEIRILQILRILQTIRNNLCPS